MRISPSGRWRRSQYPDVPLADPREKGRSAGAAAVATRLMIRCDRSREHAREPVLGAPAELAVPHGLVTRVTVRRGTIVPGGGQSSSRGGDARDRLQLAPGPGEGSFGRRQTWRRYSHPFTRKKVANARLRKRTEPT